MLTLHRPAVHATTRTNKIQKRRRVAPAVPAARVEAMLREIAFVLHATRVVGRKDSPKVRQA